MLLRFITSLLIAASFVLSSNAHALSIPTSADSVIPTATSSMAITTLGILTNHRPYQGAVSLGSPGIELGLEVSLVHLPDGFADTMSNGGLGGSSGTSSSNGGSLPDLKLHLDKGFGPNADGGLSAIWFMGSYIWGGHLKFTLNHPEEGLTTALRFCYSSTNFDLAKLGFPGVEIKDEGTGTVLGNANVKLNTSTYTIALLASNRMDFAEPYIGTQIEMTSGKLDLPVTFLPAFGLPDQVFSTSDSSATQLSIFGGIGFRIPNAGFKIAIEGGYGHLGMHTFGLWLGFTF